MDKLDKKKTIRLDINNKPIFGQDLIDWFKSFEDWKTTPRCFYETRPCFCFGGKPDEHKEQVVTWTLDTVHKAMVDYALINGWKITNYIETKTNEFGKSYSIMKWEIAANVKKNRSLLGRLLQFIKAGHRRRT